MANTDKFMGGLKDRSAKWPDSSTQLPKGPSVDSDATRSSTMDTEKEMPTIGPRTA